MYLFIYTLVWKKENLHQNSYTNSISDVINVNFDAKGTGWVGLELSNILTQTVGFDMWVTPHIDILTLAKLIYFMSKDLTTKIL